MAVLHYGLDASLGWDSLNGNAPTECGRPVGLARSDIADAVTAALAEPLDYPALPLCVTPSDRVVLALDHGVPQIAEIAATIAKLLDEAGVDPDGITVLQSPDDVSHGLGDPRRLLPARLRERVRLVIHDPADRRNLAYLAATESGDPILLHRVLHEADVVLPVGCVRRESAAGYFGIHSPIYPGFSDAHTQARYRSLSALSVTGQRHHQLEHEANEVAWLLGLHLTVQIVPGGGEDVLHVVAGQSAAVHQRGRELYHQAWGSSVPQRAGLVVAAIEGGPQQQTWENLGLALGAALDLVEDGGTVAVCCDLADEPGPAVQAMADARNRQSALKRIGKRLPFDALPAAQLARALENGRVYLLSRLDPGFCEQLEVVAVERDDVERLVRRHPSCILLSNAPHAMVTVEGE